MHVALAYYQLLALDRQLQELIVVRISAFWGLHLDVDEFSFFKQSKQEFAACLSVYIVVEFPASEHLAESLNRFRREK